MSSWNKGLRCTGDDKRQEQKHLLFKNEDHMCGVKEVMGRKPERKWKIILNGNAKCIIYLFLGNKASINLETFIKCFVLPYEESVN